MSQTEVQLIKSSSVEDGDIVGMSSSKLSGTLPAVSAANLTNIPAANLTGALPAISGAALTNLPASGKAHNLVINGAMNVAQRSVSSTTSGIATVDRFGLYHTGVDEAPTQAQADVASGTTPYTLGFRKSLKVTNGNQTSGGGAAKYIWIQSIFEGQDFATSGWNYLSSSSNITLSFWVKSSVAQNFYGYVRTVDGSSYLYPFETGSLSADTWTKVTKTIPGNSNLQIDNDNGHGFQISIFPYLGTGYTGTISLNSWSAYNSSVRVPDNTATWYTTNDSTFEITGVQIEVGDSATDFEHRSFADELARCQRYYYVHFPSGNSGKSFMNLTQYNFTTAYGHLQFACTMRTAPSLDIVTGSNYYQAYGNNGAYYVNSIVMTTSHENACEISITSNRGTGSGMWFRTSSASSKIAFNAEV